MWRAILLYNKDAEYNQRMEKIRLLLSKLKDKWKFEVSYFETSRISKDQSFKYLTDIRSTSPQTRGKIVSSRSYLLPLSGKKNLNLLNTPILILYDDSKPITVYPHLLGTFYCGIEDSLIEIEKYGASKILESRGLLDNPICEILNDDPSLLGFGLTNKGTEVSTSTGTIDLLLKNDKNDWIVVEVETHAEDFAIAQVCRLAAGFSKDNNIPLDRIRRIVVCRSFEKNLVETARVAGVELYKIDLTREI